MKKISIILFLLIAFNVLNAAVHGDVNGDGAVNAADVTAIYDVLLGVDNSLESSADVNSDDAVTSADVTDVYDVILGTYVPPVKRGKIYISCLLPRCQGLSSAGEKVSTSIQ